MNSIDRKRTMETASNNTWESKTATKRALPVSRPSPKFTVTYSRLCDGGAQEMSTAVCAIRDVFPDASISTYRRTSDEDVALGKANPEVVITDTTKNNAIVVVWSSKQKNLYQKYPKKRKKSIHQIRKACEALQTATATSTSTTASSSPPSTPRTVAARVMASAKKLSPRPSSSSSSPRPAIAIPPATIPLPTSLNISSMAFRPPYVNEVSEDFSTATTEQERSCELDENGVCTSSIHPLR